MSEKPACDFGAQNPVRLRARELLFAHGWNTTCFQILNPGINLWFSSAQDSVIGYVVRHGVRVVAGAPVCDLARLPEVIEEFESEAARAGQSVCYFGAEHRLKNWTEGSPEYSTVILGAQPYWSPDSFLQAFKHDRSLRAQINRSRNKGVSVSEWPIENVLGCAELKQCLAQWLKTRGLPPMHFLVEPETLDDLQGRRIFVAERRGHVVGFTVLSPAPQRHGYLTEQFVRGDAAPNGTVELGLYVAISTIRQEGSSYVTMGIVPLSRNGGDQHHNPAWLSLSSSWIRAHGRRFYNFDGLDLFKSKFHPDGWEPIFVISKERSFSFHTLYAIAHAFSDGPILGMFSRAVLRAIAQELTWIRKGRSLFWRRR